MKSLAGLVALIAIGCAHHATSAPQRPWAAWATTVGTEAAPKENGLAALRGTVWSVERRPLEGATVVAQGPAGEQGDITDSDGHYAITNLTPGGYAVRFFYALVKDETTIRLAGNVIGRVDATIQEGDSSGHDLTYGCCKPAWGDSTTNLGLMLDRGFLVNIPTH
jgi:hypothetical protein